MDDLFLLFIVGIAYMLHEEQMKIEREKLKLQRRSWLQKIMGR